MNLSPFDDPEQVVRALSQQRTICNEDIARVLLKIGELRKYNSGDAIAHQGQIGSELFYILSGSVNVVINGHHYRVRKRNELIGEMSVIEPGERRTADLLAKDDDTYLFVIQAADFLSTAKDHGEVWECIARELASRLRQRDEMFVPPNPKPVVFIASSSEGAQILKKAEAALSDPDRVMRPWNQPGIFRPTLGTLEELERHAREIDFAVMIVTTDDLRESRSKSALVPRDNVMLECGLFVGALERERAFVLTQSDPDLALPSDLKGVTALFYNDDAELSERLQEISDTINRKGRMLRYCKVL